MIRRRRDPKLFPAFDSTLIMTAMRYEVRFTGRVQGVFFRATAEQIARRHQVTGWVRNEPDGSVFLVAEGERDELDRFIEAVRDAKQANIEHVDLTKCAATGEFEDFRVRH